MKSMNAVQCDPGKSDSDLIRRRHEQRSEPSALAVAMQNHRRGTHQITGSERSKQQTQMQNSGEAVLSLVCLRVFPPALLTWKRNLREGFAGRSSSFKFKGPFGFRVNGQASSILARPASTSVSFERGTPNFLIRKEFSQLRC